jgi:hypothetical protein
MKKRINLFFVFIAIILGSTLVKQFDVEKLTFQKPALATLYIIVFLAAIFFLIKDYTKK